MNLSFLLRSFIFSLKPNEQFPKVASIHAIDFIVVWSSQIRQTLCVANFQKAAETLTTKLKYAGSWV